VAGYVPPGGQVAGYVPARDEIASGRLAPVEATAKVTVDFGAIGPVPELAPPPHGRADRLARRVLRVRAPKRAGAEPDVHNIFSSSIALSATRCLLSYIVLPVLAPWVGAVPLIGPAIGIPVGLVALVFDVRAIRRFFRADHRWRWVAAALYMVVMAMVTFLVARDISRLA